MKYTAALHLGIGGLALVACLLFPRPGTVLLIPVWSARPVMQAGIGWHGKVALVGRGRLPGSIVVRSDRTLPVGALLTRGIVPVAVPDVACGRPV